MKILWKGNIFNPTGIATAGREWVKALVKRGHKIQVSDIWHDGWEFNKGLEFLNSPININDPEIVTIFWDYPMFWREGRGTIIGGFVHEGTKLFEDWPYYINKADAVFVPSKAVKNLAKWNGVTKRIEVIPHGVSKSISQIQNTIKKELLFFSLLIVGQEKKATEKEQTY